MKLRNKGILDIWVKWYLFISFGNSKCPKFQSAKETIKYKISCPKSLFSSKCFLILSHSRTPKEPPETTKTTKRKQQNKKERKKKINNYHPIVSDHKRNKTIEIHVEPPEMYKHVYIQA